MSDALSDKALQELIARAEQHLKDITAGPWSIEGDGLTNTIVAPRPPCDGDDEFYGDDGPPEDVPIVMDCIDDNDARNSADIEFIVEAPELVRALIDEVMAYRKQICELLDFVEHGATFGATTAEGMNISEYLRQKMRGFFRLQANIEGACNLRISRRVK